jgi:hypothetical protein
MVDRVVDTMEFLANTGCEPETVRDFLEAVQNVEPQKIH